MTDTIYEKFFFALLGFVIALITRWINAKIPEEKELKLLASELKDIERHCKANLEVLEIIDLEEGLPSAMHFEKMKIPDSSIVFSAETFRRIEVSYSELIHALKLVIRNINIELAEAIKYQATPDCSKDVMSQYITYIKQKSYWIVDTIPSVRERLHNMTKTGLEPDERPIFNIESTTATRPKYVIYDRQFALEAKSQGIAITQQENLPANSELIIITEQAKSVDAALKQLDPRPIYQG